MNNPFLILLDRYAALSLETLTGVKEMEDFYSKKKKIRIKQKDGIGLNDSSKNAGGEELSYLEKIRLQMTLDIRQYGKEVGKIPIVMYLFYV